MSHSIRGLFIAGLVAAVLLIGACSASTALPSASPEPTFEPIASVAAETVPAKILIPNTIPSAIQYGDVMKRLNEALKESGQSVEFELRTTNYDSRGISSFVTKAREELAAGKPAADAYAFGLEDSKAAREASLTMDVSMILRQFAPAYCAKYGHIFGDEPAGMPVGIYPRPVWFKAAFLLRSDFEASGGGVSTVEGLFGFIDTALAKSGGKYMILAEPGTIVNQWALEQGYCRLSPFGIDGYLYVAKDDPQCVPVPLETIPGLEGLLTRMMQYYKSGDISGDIYTVYSRQPVGIVKDLSEYYVSNPFAWLSWIPGEFTAEVLSPDMPAVFSEPAYTAELVIPASRPASAAESVARFVEWYNASQENYDTLLYGKRGVDFEASGARFLPLKDSQPQNMKSITQMQGLFFTWPGATMLSNTEYFRVAASAPGNIEQVYDAGVKADLRFEANRLLKIDNDTIEAMQKLGVGMREVIDARIKALNDVIYGSPSAYTGESFAYCMDQLSKTRTDLLVADYQRLIADYKNGTGK